MRSITCGLLMSAILSTFFTFAETVPLLVRQNVIGDRRLMTVADVQASFAQDVVLDLMPKNTSVESERYEIRCRVVYTDPDMARLDDPTEQQDHFEATEAFLNEALTTFVGENLVGADFTELVTRYYVGDVAKDLNELFGEYVRSLVAERRAANPQDEAANVDVLMVEVRAEGAFRRWLIRSLKQDEEFSSPRQ